MSKNWTDITIALGGIFQAAALVDQLAKTGYVTTEAQRISINSILQVSPDSTLDVYGSDLRNLELGLNTLINALKSQPNRQGFDKNSTDVLRYILGLQHLQKKLLSKPDMLEVASTRIKQSIHQADLFGLDHENVLANLAGIYTDTISTFKFRIQVTGDATYLQQKRIANQVRSLLLAGIRSAMLWRQVGGTRWHMVFQRKRIVACAESLLKDIHRT